MSDKLRTPLVDKLLTVLASMDSTDEVYDFLLDLCTVREIAEMSQRLEVARLLAGGQSYLDVQDVTGASATTISRVSKCLNYGSGGYENALRIIAASDATDEAAGPEGEE